MSAKSFGPKCISTHQVRLKARELTGLPRLRIGMKGPSE